MRMRFLPDKPVVDKTEDTLGFGDFVKLIQTSIYYTEPPFVYGILGDWGSGKTSILRLLEKCLIKELDNGTYPFVPIWFNAWEYENEANIIYPLLYAIKNDYSRRFATLDTTKDFWSKFKKVTTTSFIAFSDLSLRFATKQLTGEALKLDDVVKQLEMVESHSDKLEKILGNWADQVTDLRDAFETLLDSYANDLQEQRENISDKNQVCFVIIIDDLDRCLPDTAIAILESIKNYLTVEKCVFVLGLNASVIYQGIRIKYKGLEIDGRQYLEKILNYSFYVPEPELDNVAKFATERFSQLLVDEGTKWEYQGHFETFGRILKECYFTNPRKIKRILNHYLLFISKYKNAPIQYNESNIVRLIILAEYFPDIFQLFLTETTEAKKMLIKIGNQDFDIKQFEDKFGISITPVYSQLLRMKKLFELTLPITEAEPTLAKEAQAVYSITRLS